MIWYKNNAPHAIGNTMTDHIAMAKKKKKYGEKIGLVYDDSYFFHEDIIRCNPYIDISVPKSQYDGSFKLLDPCDDMSWNYLIYNSEEVFFNFPIEFEKEYFKILKEHNIDIERDKIISIHAREPGFFSRSNKLHDIDRFVDISNFIEVSKMLIDDGYKIIRIGSKENTLFPKIDGLYDSISLKDKKLLFDMYCISKSKLLLECDSGIWPIGVAFNVPVVQSNSVHGQPNMGSKRHWFPWQGKYIVLNKHCFVDNKKITISEAVKFFDGWEWVSDNRVKLFDNTYLELYDACNKLLNGDK